VNLSDVTILITSFMRPGYLATCVAGIRKNLADVPIVIVDDSGDVVDLEPYPEAFRVKLDFDAGLSAKRNAGVDVCKTKYVLLSHDDNDFSNPETRAGIERLFEVLESHPEIDVAAGRLDDRPYEGLLEHVHGSHVKEHRLGRPVRYQEFFPCDITGNYFLARTDLLRQYRWDNELKLHEHGEWFLTLKDAGRLTVWVPGVKGPCQRKDPSKQHPDYDRYRARKECHQLFMAKRGISQYFSFDQPVRLPKPHSVKNLRFQPSERPSPIDDVVIAVITCKQNRSRVEIQERTWIPELRALGYRVEIFDGERLGVADDYYSLPAKTKALCQWAKADKIERMLKIDDDGMIDPRTFYVPAFDYCGMTLPANDMGNIKPPAVPAYPRGTFPHRYCSGGAYWLSAPSIAIGADAPPTNDWAEDRWLGHALAAHGIKPTSLDGYAWVMYGRAPSGWIVLTQVPEKSALTIWSDSKRFANPGQGKFSAAFAY